MKLTEAINKQRVVAIYPGRFQPAASHHIAAYQNLVAKFGAANVYVATSNATGPKSPFSFVEKKKIISAAGVPSSKIVKVKNPYRAEEITSKFVPKTAAALFLANTLINIKMAKSWMDIKSTATFISFRTSHSK